RNKLMSELWCSMLYTFTQGSSVPISDSCNAQKSEPHGPGQAWCRAMHRAYGARSWASVDARPLSFRHSISATALDFLKPHTLPAASLLGVAGFSLVGLV